MRDSMMVVHECAAGNEGAEALVALVKKHTGIVQLGFHGNIVRSMP